MINIPEEKKSRFADEFRNITRVLRYLIFFYLAFSLVFPTPQLLARGHSPLFKPNSVLVIIGNQWKDPQSFLVSDDSDFKRVTVLLKSWCIPFDIIRLDEHRLDKYHFLGPDLRPLYGAVIWLVPMHINEEQIKVGPLPKIIMESGIGLIAFADTAQHPAIQSLLGIKWIGETVSDASVKITSQNFITQGSLKNNALSRAGANTRVPIVESLNADVLACRGSHPVLTLRKTNHDGRCIWIYGSPEKLLDTQTERIWFRRAIAEAMGYSVVKTWKDHVILRMDDPGSAQNAWLKSWHYPTLTAEQIRNWIIKPLKKHNAKLTVFVVPGFVNDNTRSIEPSWQERFVDKFDTLQDYQSTKKGLDEGVAQGVIEIQSHGWTHMQPDLDTEPGPWWDSPLNKQRAEVEWYREFYDRLRGKEIPASVQMRRMRISGEWIRFQFGQYPVAFIPGGYGVSRSPERNTWRLAGRSGFGWLDGYLGKDMAFEGWLFDGTEDVPQFKKVPPDGHDYGITQEPMAFAHYLERKGDVIYIGYSDYIAYMHSSIQMKGGNILKIIFNWQNPLCQALVHCESQWSLLLSNWLREKIGGNYITLEIDGHRTKVPASAKIDFSIPAGGHSHTVTLIPDTDH